MKSTVLVLSISLLLVRSSAPPSAWAEEPSITETYAAALEQVETGDFEAAARYMSKALEIAVKDLPPGDLQIGILAFNLGRIHSKLGRYDQARIDLELAVSVYTAAHGKDAEDLIPPLDALADCLDELDEGEEAFEVRKRILAVTEKVYGKNSVEVANVLPPLAQYAGRAGKSRKANGYLRRAYKIWKKEKGEESREAATALLFLGLNDLSLGELARGFDRMEEAVEIIERTVPDGDPDKIQLYAMLLQIAEQMSGVPGVGGGLLDADELEAKLTSNRKIAAAKGTTTEATAGASR